MLAGRVVPQVAGDVDVDVRRCDPVEEEVTGAAADGDLLDHLLRVAGGALVVLASALGISVALATRPTPTASPPVAERDQAAIDHLCATTGERDPIVIPQLDGDVHDVDGLVAIHGHLFAG